MVAGYGLWRAARAARAGDPLTGLTLTGLVGALVSPITWTHHIYWFVPAVVLLADAALSADRPDEARRRRWLAGLALGITAVTIYGVVTFQAWGAGPVRTHDPVDFVVQNTYVLLSLLLLVALPVRRELAVRKIAPNGQISRVAMIGANLSSSTSSVARVAPIPR